MACASAARAPSRAPTGTSGGAAIGRAPAQRYRALRTTHIYASSAAGQAGGHRPAHSQAARSARGAGASDNAGGGGGGLLRRLLVSGIGAAALLAVATVPQPASAAVDTSSSVFGFGGSAAATVRPAFLEDKEPLPPPGLNPQEQATIALFRENTPAVVNIANIAAVRNYYSLDVMKIPQGQGSGFIWDSNGHLVTNYHVIRNAVEVQVALIDQSVFKAKVVGVDPTKDIAVLQLEAPESVIRNLKPVTLGSSSNLAVGQQVFAIGNPFGLDHTLTSGIISGLNRELGSSLRGVIQTDAAINPGNSGGVLLDSRGRLIGINTAIADPSGRGANAGVGFAIPIDSARGLVEQILKYGRVVRPVIGITIAPPQALRNMGIEGVLVLDVPPGGPASKAGMLGISRDATGRLVLGDVIVGVNGRPVHREGDLFDVLDSCKVGDRVRVEVLRRGKERRTLEVVLTERAPERLE